MTWEFMWEGLWKSLGQLCAQGQVCPQSPLDRWPSPAHASSNSSLLGPQSLCLV